MATETAAESGTSRGRKSAPRTRKTTARKRTTTRRARKTTVAADATPTGTTRARASARASGGSPRLADTLTGLLSEVSSEVETVTALSAAIDEAARALQERLTDYTDRMATMSRLRASVSGGTLASFLDEVLVPGRPTELEVLAQRIVAAQKATI